MIKKCFIDLETTGLDPKKNGIVEIAGIIESGNVVKEFQYRSRPFAEDEISQEALDVNRLTQDQINEFPPAKDVHRILVKLFSRYVNRYNRKDKFFFIAFNALFDSQFLREFFKKTGDQYYGSYFWHPPIDVMTLAAFHLMKNRPEMPDFHLGTVARHVGIEYNESVAHAAMYDVVVTRELYYKLIDTSR